jgi:hypothetical protein
MTPIPPPTGGYEKLLSDLHDLERDRPDDTRMPIMRGDCRKLLALARWALEAREALQAGFVEYGPSMTTRSDRKALMKIEKSLSTFPPLP